MKKTRTKTIHSKDYARCLELFRHVRERQGMTQEQLAERLGVTQSFVSKCERGERRIDVIELRSFCRAMGVSLVSFAAELEQLLESCSLP